MSKTITPIVIITRFNLAMKYKYPKLSKSVYGRETAIWLDPDYLTRRFELFDQYTFPSFLSQTYSDYRWIVLFHKDTPQQFHDRIKMYEEQLPQFEPWFLSDIESEHFEQIIDKELEKHSDTGTISVRVDNDDVIHKTFIEMIRESLNNCNETTILSFRNGLQYDALTGRCMRYDYVNNHFLALYSAKGVGNVLSFAHTGVDTLVDEEHKIVLKTDIPLWVEIVSESNCTNEIWNRPSKVFVPFCLVAEYPMLKIKWNNRFQWICSIIRYIPVAFFKMFIDVFRIIFIRLKDRKN